MPVNVKLLKKVRKLIAEEPRRLRMLGWGNRIQKRILRADKDKLLPPCGTQACLAGWTVLAARPSVLEKMHPRYRTLLGVMMDEGTNVADEAARLLGMPADECPFDAVNWTAPDVLAWIDRQIDAASK